MDLKKELGGVADAVTKIMMGEKALHPNQQKLDVHEPEKDELTADDFKKLRAGKKTPEVKKEEVEELDELTGKSQLPKIAAYHKQKGDEAKGKMETIRNTNKQVPVPKEKSAKIYAKDSESAYHYTQAKRAKALMAKEEVESLDEVSKKLLRSYLKGSKAEAGSQLRGDVSDKAASLGRTQQDKDDGRYEGGRLAKRKLGTPGTIPAKVMAK
jgi:hypothetical protein